uniref:Rhodanese domain-containing protein n=1 Tax=Romanomermis culicivorax TaxID=13658 RepID=A0A915I2U5_ROMCU
MLTKACTTTAYSMRNAHASVVSVEWLAQNFSPAAATSNKIKLVHAVMHSGEFAEGHIPGATCFNVAACRDTLSRYPAMLPKSQDFEEYINENVHVSNEDHIVVYDSNTDAPSLLPGSRVWFMFKIFGHDNVSLLNGGLFQWKQEGRPIAKSPILRKVEGKFHAKFRPELLIPFEQVLKNVETREYQVIDARGASRFKGQVDDPHGKAGHMPNALNLPFTSMVDTETKLLLSKDQIKALFDKIGANFEKPMFTSIHSAVMRYFFTTLMTDGNKAICNY